MTLERGNVVPLVVTIVAVSATLQLLRHPVSKVTTNLYLKWKLRRLGSEEEDGTQASVSGLYIHPVKSLQAVSLEKVELDDKGFVGDRRIMIVYAVPLPLWKDKFSAEDVTHRFLTQRQCPSLARVKATVENEQLTLDYGGTTLTVSIQPGLPKKSHRVGIWQDVVVVDDLGDLAAAFFQSIVDSDKESAAAGGMYTGIRLVIHTLKDRKANSKFTPDVATNWFGVPPAVSLADGFPILIACQASLDELNHQLALNGKSPVPMSRFRPNIVIQGTKAFEEDNWKYIAIGNQLFAIVKACPRCKQSCTDQETGEVHSEPVETMKQFRALGEHSGDVFFAQNAIPLGQTGTIQVGDTIRVLQRGDPIYL